VDLWASREASASFDFFKCLVARVATTFFTGALGAFGDFTTGSTSCKEGSSAAIFSTKGAAAASLFGSSLSLQRKQKARGFAYLKKKKANTKVT
jgi:hypothetical protein